MEMFWGVPFGTDEEKIKNWAKKIGFTIIKTEQVGKYTTYTLAEKIKNKVGQPMKNITKEEILALRKKGNSMATIAKITGVSRKTLYNRISKK